MHRHGKDYVENEAVKVERHEAQMSLCLSKIILIYRNAILSLILCLFLCCIM